jgi:hypothetical protein
VITALSERVAVVLQWQPFITLVYREKYLVMKQIHLLIEDD